MFVYVLNMHGEPLMPCKPRKARRLLEEEKAKVVNRTPFTIQLLYGSSGYFQLKKFDGTVISQGVSSKRLKLLEPIKGWLVDWRVAIPSST